MKISAKAQAAFNTVIHKMQSGDLSDVIQVARIARDPADRMPSDRWSFRNRVLAFLQTDTLDCRGYRQWQKAGRQVQKGSKAAYILAPLSKKIEEEGEEKVILYGFKAIPVFSVDCTEGDPLPEFDYRPSILPPLADVAHQYGIDVQWTPLPPDRLGQCSRDGQEIKVGTHDPKTWFHELAHAIHAKIEDLSGESDDRLEVVAEFTATVLMELYGYGDRTGNAWEYISGYAKDPLEAIMKALGTVEQIMEMLEV